jgi:hypothetical protein
MLDELMRMAQQYAPQVLENNQEVQTTQQGAIAQEASTSMFTGMQELLRTGGPGAIKGLMEGAQSQDPENPQMQQVSQHFENNLTQKMGISSGMAKTIGMALIPMLLSKLFNRTKDPNDTGFNIQDMLGSLMGGGAAGGLGGMLGGMLGGGNTQAGAPAQQPQAAGVPGGALSDLGTKFGLDKDGDGDTDLQDLMGMFR